MRHMLMHNGVRRALAGRKPVVALESTVIAHGLPWPENHQTARELEATVRSHGAMPATIAVLGGLVHVGLEEAEMERVARDRDAWKVSRRDFPVVISRRLDGATTVAGTMLAAHWAGIRVMATGGIGGVHRGDRTDVSADLPELGRTPVVVVSAGAKAILDLAATREWLETNAIPVIGYGTAEMPAFWSRESGIALDVSAETPEQVAAIARTVWECGLSSGVLVCVPCPAEAAIPRATIDDIIGQAIEEAVAEGVRGKALTPRLLARVNELTGGRSLAANRALLQNNAAVAAQIAVALGFPHVGD